jgi:serine/threonine protein phosphatase PrpC
MEIAQYKKSLVAAASITPKSENQDSKAEFESDYFNAIFIGDGLGSFKYAKTASEKVVDYLLSKAKAIDGPSINSGDIPFEQIFHDSKSMLIDFAANNLSKTELELDNMLGTTAIAALEIGNSFAIAYAGNGAVWHIRGNFTDFPGTYHFPWNAINYLNPNTVPEKGKEALYRLISNNADFSECVPTVIKIGKDVHFGDIIMVCSDGIYSADQLKTGMNDKGIWVRYEQCMIAFYSHLKRFFTDGLEYDKSGLAAMLERFLNEIKGTLDDDATVGIFITKEVLNYQRKMRPEQNEINSNIQV